MQDNPWIRQARKHWQEFRPTMFEDMKQAGTLEAALAEAAERTYLEMTALEEAGFKYHEAWEMVRERYLFLPEEEGLEDHEPLTPMQELRREVMRSSARLRRVVDFAISNPGFDITEEMLDPNIELPDYMMED